MAGERSTADGTAAGTSGAQPLWRSRWQMSSGMQLGPRWWRQHRRHDRRHGRQLDANPTGHEEKNTLAYNSVLAEIQPCSPIIPSCDRQANFLEKGEASMGNRNIHAYLPPPFSARPGE